MASEKILLGSGIFKVGTTAIGLTRGGGSFIIEREYREIEADGDMGPVKDRIVIDREVAKLSVKALEMLTDNFKKFYPAMDFTTGKLTSTLNILLTDYNDFSWVGKTKDGKAVTITLTDAINLGNLEWALEDKNEVLQELELTATYDEAARTTPPWDVTYAS